MQTSSASLRSTWIDFAVTAGISDSIAASIVVLRSTVAVSRWSLPPTMRDTSRMSSINWACAAAFCRTTSAARCTVGRSPGLCPSTCAQPMIAFSGVRSSCDRVARNSSFSRLAASASSRAACSRSSSPTRSCSMRVRSSISADSFEVGGRQLAGALGNGLFELFLALAQRLLPVEQLDEDRHLRPQHVGRDRLDQVIHGADVVAAEHVRRAPVVGGQEDDRRLLRSRPLADQRGRLVAVDVGHHDVEQDQGEVLLEDLAQRLAPGPRPDNPVVRLVEHGLEGDQVLVAVVDDENVDLVHRDSQTRSREIRWSVSTGLVT